ncbi:MAG: hypothetical protein H7175_13415 [Burkholderiales bacterium]|nr:hypothetical protein [Anaerolineae bacterium]
MRKASVLVTLVCLCLALFGTAVQAQTAPIFCSTLAQADCAILQNVPAAGTGVNSTTFDFDLNIGVANVPGMPSQSMNFGLTGDGSWAIDPAVRASMAAMDPAAMDVAMLTSAVQAFDLDLTITLNLPQELMAMAAAQSGQAPPSSITLEMLMVDGIGYLNFDQLVGLMPPNSGLPTGWQGLDFAEVVTMMGPSMGTMMGSGQVMNPSASIGKMDSATVAAMSEFTSITRLADADINGMPVAVFQTNVDLVQLLNSDAVMSAMSSDPSTAMQMQQLSAVSDSLTAGNISITQYVGLSDNIGYQTELLITASMDPTAFDPTVPVGGTPVDISVNGRFTQSNINAAPAVSAPAGATLNPAEELFGGMLGGMPQS